MKNMANSDYAVVYMSKYGASEKYAKIIAQNLQADLFNAGEKSLGETLRPYDTIIWGGGIYAGKINGINILSRHIDMLNDRRIIVFSVGNTPADRHDILEKVRNNSISHKQRSKIIFFHFVARANFSSLTLTDRFMFAFRRLAIILKPDKFRTDGERLFLSEYGKDSQIIDENATKRLIDTVKHGKEKQ